jgi:hypothetical protein
VALRVVGQIGMFVVRGDGSLGAERGHDLARCIFSFEAVNHDLAPCLDKAPGDGVPNSAGRAGNQHDLSRNADCHAVSTLVLFQRVSALGLCFVALPNRISGAHFSWKHSSAFLRLLGTVFQDACQVCCTSRKPPISALSFGVNVIRSDFMSGNPDECFRKNGQISCSDRSA